MVETLEGVGVAKGAPEPLRGGGRVHAVCELFVAEHRTLYVLGASMASSLTSLVLSSLPVLPSSFWFAAPALDRAACVASAPCCFPCARLCLAWCFFLRRHGLRGLPVVLAPTWTLVSAGTSLAAGVVDVLDAAGSADPGGAGRNAAPPAFGEDGVSTRRRTPRSWRSCSSRKHTQKFKCTVCKCTREKKVIKF